MKQLVLIALALFWPMTAAAQSCRADSVYLKGGWGQARFSVELADNGDERARGLMFRESLPQSGGMLFVYPSPRIVSFWMQNTLIPLDMIFIDDTGMVRKVHHSAVPGDITGISSDSQVLAVLEINGGLSQAMGISPGTVLHHPAFDPKQAVWPCEDKFSD
ncbi:hypothetical protein TG4357_00237 [Thalassovita gelatinovora]|uniref:ACR n=1 Tax=Thalassovita gelatinovora TaxID=53501 RepID=A0A0P1F4I2_THAGE|nr:DUF192 domain-containing protein [Thalassovita gelatinovora]CUH62670.1 hypothetical protein TG4357_00237 [Thalassovita gelatinovora]SEQ08253.1 hypothetical protein SAMN04488043_103137 [Thalassovita gelatinovora]